MFYAERAVILAAGIGMRLQPVTLNTPKPLIRVNGVRMIDSIISGLHANGVYEIYVVVGHLKEQFLDLEATHCGLKLIYNPVYASCNNISSLYYAREHLCDCIIIEGDQLVINPSVFAPGFERSGYCCEWTERTYEWFQSVENGIVVASSKNGGRNGWEVHGVSFWSEADGARLKRHLEEEFVMRGARDVFWDEIALFLYPGEYALGIRPVMGGDVIEIDSIQELAELDPSYADCLMKEP